MQNIISILDAKLFLNKWLASVRNENRTDIGKRQAVVAVLQLLQFQNR